MTGSMACEISVLLFLSMLSLLGQTIFAVPHKDDIAKGATKQPSKEASKEVSQYEQELQEKAFTALYESVADPEIELVINRKDEPLKWLSVLPANYRVTIYNQGGIPERPSKWPTERTWELVNLTSGGSQYNAFAEHLVRRYDSLAPYTVFSEADPLYRNPHFLDLLSSQDLKSVQALSGVHLPDPNNKNPPPIEGHTPPAVVRAMSSRHPHFRSERCSTRTLNSVWYHDQGTVQIHKKYMEVYKLSPGTNLMRHAFSLLGLPDWMREEQEVGSFAWGAVMGFERDRARQHKKEVYEALVHLSMEASPQKYMVERLFLMLLGGPHFRD